MTAETSPRRIGARSSRHVHCQYRGRAMRTKPMAPRVMRSHAVPATPMSSNSPTEMAAPSCTENMATTASDHAGTRSIGSRSQCTILH